MNFDKLETKLVHEILVTKSAQKSISHALSRSTTGLLFIMAADAVLHEMTSDEIVKKMTLAAMKITNAIMLTLTLIQLPMNWYHEKQIENKTKTLNQIREFKENNTNHNIQDFLVFLETKDNPQRKP